MTEREKILGRVREALAVRAPRPGAHSTDAPHQHSVSRNIAIEARQWLPPVGPSIEEQIAAFATNCVELKAGFHSAADPAALTVALRQLRETEGWQRVAAHTGQLTDHACRALALPVLHTDQPYDVNELEKCDAGITECDALVAQTGSVLLTCRSAGGRALSVLPPHHVVLATLDQMVPDLPAAIDLLQRKYAERYPSFISLITGPSRTGDIERILVLGAHGPKKLTVFCLGP